MPDLSIKCLLLALITERVAAESTRPHLLFMMSDQMRYDAMGSYAGDYNRAARTPALDRIAREGMLVRYAASSTPTCTPARAALLTGRSPWNHGMLGYGVVADRYPLEMPRVLAGAGYHTRVIGKNHFGWNTTSDTGIQHGFQKLTICDGLGHWDKKAKHHWSDTYDDYDKWFQAQMPGKDPQATLDGLDREGWNTWQARPFIYNESLHPTAWVGRQAVSFLKSYPNTTDAQPFMLKVSFHRPHSPYDPPKRVLDAVKADDLRPIRLCHGAAKSNGSTAPNGDGKWCLQFRGKEGDSSGCGPKNPDAWCGLMPEKAATLSRRAYTASVNFVDEWIGHIYGALVERNLLERTWILWTSDHGDGQGDMFHWRKGYPYEFSTHIPMLLRWPESWARAQPKGSIVDRGTELPPPVVTEMRDVFHTFVDAAGIANDAKLVPPRNSKDAARFASEDGKSMLCLLRDPSGKSDCDYAPNPGPWRQWIDMEHANAVKWSMHWSGLTDGKMKYVVRAMDGQEQLFNLTADPYEEAEVSGVAAYASVLKLWRSRLVQQFEHEGRGNQWVRNGKLMHRRKSQTYSPHFPKSERTVGGELEEVFV